MSFGVAFVVLACSVLVSANLSAELQKRLQVFNTDAVNNTDFTARKRRKGRRSDIAGGSELRPHVMHTFYEPLDNKYRDDTAGILQLGAWAKTWKQAGFLTRVLTEHDAEKHPLFSMVEERVSKFKLSSYDQMCYRR